MNGTKKASHSDLIIKKAWRGVIKIDALVAAKQKIILSCPWIYPISFVILLASLNENLFDGKSSLFLKVFKFVFKLVFGAYSRKKLFADKFFRIYSIDKPTFSDMPLLFLQNYWPKRKILLFPEMRVTRYTADLKIYSQPAHLKHIDEFGF